MRRTLLILAVVSLAAAACGDGSSSPVDDGSTPASTADADPATSSTAPTTAAPSESGSTTSTVTDDRPVAPDFTLDLGTGGTFVLSEETRPVYLVFWAEW